MAIRHEWERGAETEAEAEDVGPWTGHAGIDRRVLEMRMRSGAAASRLSTASSQAQRTSTASRH